MSEFDKKRLDRNVFSCYNNNAEEAGEWNHQLAYANSSAKKIIEDPKSPLDK